MESHKAVGWHTLKPYFILTLSLLGQCNREKYVYKYIREFRQGFVYHQVMYTSLFTCCVQYAHINSSLDNKIICIIFKEDLGLERKSDR